MSGLKQPPIKSFIKGFVKMTPRQIIIMLVGNIILALGVALFGKAGLGNHPFHTMLYAAANLIGGDLWHTYANCQVALNIVLFIIVFCFGRSHIGLGTVVNMFLLGYAVDGFGKLLDILNINPAAMGGDYLIKWLGLKNIWQLVLEILAMIFISLGISLYQAGNLGAAPYDALPLIAVDHKKPFAPFRMLADGSCFILTIILTLVCGFQNAPVEAKIGLGTVLTVFCTGPFIRFFDRTVSYKLAGITE
ncbi:MAG: hypothetical protein IJJ40_01095 [Clostridia bacterium]|nr:hypothetical protein [Clostridia bacterium]